MSEPANNPFFGTDFSKFMKLSPMMDAFKTPHYDMNALMNIQQTSLETLTSINQTILENVQSFAQRQGKLMQQSFEETAHLTNSLMNATMSLPLAHNTTL
jgi:hypothetical protein